MPPTEQAEEILRNAKELAEQGKFNAAFAQFELAIRRNFGNSQLHGEFGAALLNAGRFPKAVQHFHKALELDPGGLVNIEPLVRALSHDVRQEQDVEIFQKIVEKSDRADLFHQWAKTLARLNRCDRAIETFGLALKKDPQIDLDVDTFVQTLKATNTPEQHIKKFQDDVDKLNNEYATNTWGKILFGLTRYTEAAVQFEKAATLKPDSVDAYINHGWTLIALGDHKQAIEVLRKALKCDEKSLLAYVYLGRALHEIEAYQEAASNFQVASVKAPSEAYFPPWINTLKKLPDPEPAIAEYEKALETGNSIWTPLLGEFLKQRGQLEKSAIQFARFLPFHKTLEALSQQQPTPNFWEAFNTLEDSERILYPLKNADVLLQETLSDLQDPQPTLDAIQEIFDQSTDPTLYIDWGQLLARMDHVERAKDQLSKAVLQVPLIISYLEPLKISPLEALKEFVLAFKSPADRSVALDQIGKAVNEQDNRAMEVRWAQLLVTDLDSFERGLAIFQRILTTSPSHGIKDTFSAVLRNAPNQMSAIESTQAAVDKSKDADVFYQWALILLALDRQKPAIEALQRATELKHDHSDAHYQLARLFAQRGDYKKARNEFQKSDSNHSSARVLQDWGTSLMKGGRREEAIQKYLQALRRGGDLLTFRKLLNWDDELIARFQTVVDEVHTAYLYHQWGSLLRGIKRYELSIQQFKQSISLDPDRGDSYAEWLKALAAWGLTPERLNEYEQSLVKYHDEAGSFYWLARFLFNLRQRDLAIQKLNQALERDPKNGQARTLLINCWLIANDSEQAKKESHQLLADEPQNGYGYYGLSYSAYMEGDYEESIRQAELGIEKGVDALYLHGRSAWGWYKLGREDLARKKFEDAIKIDPSAEAYYDQGGLLMEMNRYDEATVAFEKTLELKPDHIYASHNLAVIPYNQGRYEESWGKIRNVIELYKKQGPFLDRALEDGSAGSEEAIYQAMLLVATTPNAHEEAKTILKAGLEFDQNNPTVLRALADLHWDYKEEFIDSQSASNRKKSECYWQGMEYFLRAERLLKELLQRCSNYDIHVELGELYLGHEDYDKARSCFEEARTKDEKAVTPHARLGVIHLRERQPDKAIPLLQEALKRNPNDLEVKSSLAEAYLRAEKLDDAETTYRQVLNIAPNHVQSYIGLGEVCLAMGDKDSDRYSEGFEHFSRALETAENEKIRSKYLKKQEKAAVYYQRGYASVQLYEGLGSRKDTKLLEAAKKDFDSCYKLNPLHPKAKRAKEKVDKRLAYFSRDRLTETIGPRTIYWMSIIVFAVVQLAFFAMPFYNRPSLIVSDKSLQAAAAQASPEEMQSLAGLKNIKFSNTEDLANRVKPLVKANVDKITAAVLDNAEKVKPVQNFPELDGGYYALLTFGSLLFMVVGLYLPQILKLRVAGIELEKSSVDQASTGGTLGISR